MQEGHGQCTFSSTITIIRYHNDITALSTINGIVTDNLQKANALNSQLKSVFTEELHGTLPHKGPSPHPVMLDIDITTSSTVIKPQYPQQPAQMELVQESYKKCTVQLLQFSKQFSTALLILELFQMIGRQKILLLYLRRVTDSKLATTSQFL